ncbi:MAG: ATP-binding protein, partial [Oscillospiraceae bacterium]
MTEGLDLKLLPRGGLVLCAVSGGADSVCLLRLLLEAAPGLNMRVECAHFNHCLR